MVKGGGRDILAFAAAFEGEFSPRWLADLAGTSSSNALSMLKQAVRNGWVSKEGPEAFRFVDLEKRRKLIDRLSAKDRQEIYLQIVDILQRELPDGDGKLDAISKYLLQTTNDIVRSRWLIAAAAKYVKAYHTSEALQCYAKVLQDLMPLHDAGSDSLFAEAAIEYSKISTARQDTDKVLALLGEAMTRLSKCDRDDLKALVEMQRAKNEWLRSNYKRALECFEHGWSIAKELNNPRILRAANVFVTFFLFWQGRFEETVRRYEEFVPDVERLPSGAFPLIAALMVGRCYVFIGRVAEGIGMLDAIQTHCLERGNTKVAAHACYTLGATMADIRRLDDAQLYLEKALNDANMQHPSWVTIRALVTLAYVHFLRQNNEKCTHYLREYLRHSREVNVSVSPYSYWMELCWAARQGRLSQIDGLDFARETEEMIDGNNIYLQGIAYRYRALLAREQGETNEVIMGLLTLSAQRLTESGHRVELAMTECELARQFHTQGRFDKARQSAEKAAEIIAPFGNDFLPDDVKKLVRRSGSHDNLLEEILRLSQDIVTERGHREVAQHIISVSNRLTEAERGAIFLSEPREKSGIALRVSKNLTAADIENAKFAKSLQLIKKVIREDKGYIGPLPENENVPSCICVPMVLRDEVVGALYHDNRFLRKCFNSEDLKLLAHFASLAAFALDNAKAYEEITRLNQKLSQEKEYLEEQQLQDLYLDEIIGASPAIKQVGLQIRQVAASDVTVLILGETGVGKELVARAIHHHSRRKNKPFIRVHCSALPESLMASELFGHERGAFTGAVARRIGRFELADGGTLFLDEIGELPQAIQLLLLRVLQSKEFERVGGSETLRSDFRLIAATNADLERKVKENQFRADLFYRLNVFPIRVPPLGNRKMDIPLLVDFFLKNYSTKLKQTVRHVRDEDLRRLLDYDWPGNVRELENIVERGVLLSSGGYLTVVELGTGRPQDVSRNAPVTLKENERQHILSALQKTNWKVRGPGGAAELLDIHPSTLAFRMNKLGIRPPYKRQQ